jgi:hypothetical protein
VDGGVVDCPEFWEPLELEWPNGHQLDDELSCAAASSAIINPTVAQANTKDNIAHRFGLTFSKTLLREGKTTVSSHRRIATPFCSRIGDLGGICGLAIRPGATDSAAQESPTRVVSRK